MKMYLGQMVGLCCGGVAGSEVTPSRAVNEAKAATVPRAGPILRYPYW